MKDPEVLKITIITVCKNSEQFLKETIESVINQTYRHIEYIIIDGKSDDGTLEIIEQYKSKIAAWKSENDNSMYEAINKGLQLATGDYILCLNSDDVLADHEVIQKVAEAIQKERRSYYYGNLVKLKDGKSKRVNLFHVNFRQLLFSTHSTFVPHPCFFIAAETNQQLGGYDNVYKYAADYDYILRALKATSSSGKYVNLDITKFRIHQGSITASGKILSERKEILLRHGYYKSSRLKRDFFYYSLWIYYKLINVKNSYQAG